jgi:hypothetical protein
MYVASQSSSQIVLLIAAVCRRDEREECKLSGLFRAAAASSATYAARRLARTTWVREDTIMRYLTEIYYVDRYVGSFEFLICTGYVTSNGIIALNYELRD